MSTQPLGTIPEWTWGDRVRKVRRLAKLGQAELAAIMTVSPATVAAWEASLNEPRNAVAIAKRIEVALGVPATWMLGLDAGPSPSSQALPPSAGGSMTTARYAHYVTAA